jgi:hypothetical protein
MLSGAIHACGGLTNDVTDNVIDDVVWKTLIHICLLSGFVCDCLV